MKKIFCSYIMVKVDGWFTSYYGNKWKEAKEHMERISAMVDWKGVKYIVEPFCGSAGFSRYVFFNVPDFTGTFLWTDMDPGLIGFYKIVKEGGFLELAEKIKEDCGKIKNKEDFQAYRAGLDVATGEGWYAMNKVRGGFRADLFNLESLVSASKRDYTGLEALVDLIKSDRVIVKCQDCSATFAECVELAMSDWKSVFVFSDPPYFETNNSYYASSVARDVLSSGCNGTYSTPDQTGIFVEIRRSMTEKKMLSLSIINHCAMLADYFSGSVALVYDKYYNQAHKNKHTGESFKKYTKHMIVCNAPAVEFIPSVVVEKKKRGVKT